MSLCIVWCCSNTIFYGQYSTQVKEELLNDILCLKGRSFFCIEVHSHGIVRSKYYGAKTKRMNVNCPVAESSESIEPNDTDLELNAMLTFSKIDSNLKFITEYAGSFGDRELLAFSSESNGETKKKKRFLCCAV